MKYPHTVLFVALALAGCSQGTEPGSDAVTDSNASSAATTTPPENAKPLAMESSPLVVDSGSITQQEKEVLAGATWTSKQCALTTPEGSNEVVAADDGPTRLAGYFIAPDDKPAGDFDVVLKGASNYRIPARTGWDRTDVAEFFKLPDLATSGFEIDAMLAEIPAGEYEVDFTLDRGGAKYFCESGKTLVVD